MFTETDKKIDCTVLKKLQAYPQVVKTYYQNLIAEGKTYRTAQTYINVVTHFADYINLNGKAIVPLYEDIREGEFYEGIEPDDIEQFIYALKSKSIPGKEASPETKATNWTALYSFFDFLTPQYIILNPVINVKRPEVDKKPKSSKLSNMAKQIILNAPITELDLTNRTHNVLKRAQIYTIGDLCDLSIEECRQIRNFGQASLREIEKVLSEIGLRLRKTKREIDKRPQDGTHITTKHDWKCEPVSNVTITADFQLELTVEQREVLKQGYTPLSMEHKWFYYYERGKLYIFRSWSGRCLYIVKLNEKGSIHTVTAFAYDTTHIEKTQQEIVDKITKLLLRFTEPSFYLD